MDFLRIKQVEYHPYIHSRLSESYRILHMQKDAFPSLHCVSLTIHFHQANRAESIHPSIRPIIAHNKGAPSNAHDKSPWLEAQFSASPRYPSTEVKKK